MLAVLVLGPHFMPTEVAHALQRLWHEWRCCPSDCLPIGRQSWRSCPAIAGQLVAQFC